jgi:4-carboxymuconolactone decarboxylase
MNKDLYKQGLAIRRAVLGNQYVDAQLKNADDFNRPMQELVTEYCWGAVWGRKGLPRKTRSMLNLAMISILNRPHELRAHLRGALTNGVTKAEISEIFLQVAIYGGVPAAVDAFRIARETFAELGQQRRKPRLTVRTKPASSRPGGSSSSKSGRNGQKA